MIRTGDAELAVSVTGASAQPGGAWHGDNYTPAANFVVSLDMTLTNATSESVITPMLSWRFAPPVARSPGRPTMAATSRP